MMCTHAKEEEKKTKVFSQRGFGVVSEAKTLIADNLIDSLFKHQW